MGILFKKKKTKFEITSIIVIYLFMFAIPVVFNSEEEQEIKTAEGLLSYKEGYRGAIMTILSSGGSELAFSCAENSFLDKPNCFSEAEYKELHNKNAVISYKEKTIYPGIKYKVKQIQKIEIPEVKKIQSRKLGEVNNNHLLLVISTILFIIILVI